MAGRVCQRYDIAQGVLLLQHHREVKTASHFWAVYFRPEDSQYREYVGYAYEAEKMVEVTFNFVEVPDLDVESIHDIPDLFELLHAEYLLCKEG